MLMAHVWAQPGPGHSMSPFRRCRPEVLSSEEVLQGAWSSAGRVRAAEGSTWTAWQSVVPKPAGLEPAASWGRHCLVGLALDLWRAQLVLSGDWPGEGTPKSPSNPELMRLTGPFQLGLKDQGGPRQQSKGRGRT